MVCQMEGNNKVSGGGENGSSSDGRPPIPLNAAYRNCFSAGRAPSTCRKTLVRHPSLAKTPEIPLEPLTMIEGETEFLPIVRSGAWTDIGIRSSMEDVYVCVDDFTNQYGLERISERPNAFYGVFDGHGGKHAADFACCHIPQYISEDEDFPREIERVITSAFLQTDNAFAEACSLDAGLAAGPWSWQMLVTVEQYYVGRARQLRCRETTSLIT